MNLRTALWAAPAALSVALVLSATAPSLSGQAVSQVGEISLAHAAPRAKPWPPRPENIVHLSSVAVNAPRDLQPQQLWSAYLVPSDSSLVVTNVALLGAEMNLLESSALGFSHRRAGEAAPALAGSPGDPGAPLGWVFGPGTQVAVQNASAQPLPLQYELVGYLVRN